jgi:hypothetical protein
MPAVVGGGLTGRSGTGVVNVFGAVSPNPRTLRQTTPTFSSLHPLPLESMAFLVHLSPAAC